MMIPAPMPLPSSMKSMFRHVPIHAALPFSDCGEVGDVLHVDRHGELGLHVGLDIGPGNPFVQAAAQYGARPRVHHRGHADSDGEDPHLPAPCIPLESGQAIADGLQEVRGEVGRFRDGRAQVGVENRAREITHGDLHGIGHEIDSQHVAVPGIDRNVSRPLPVGDGHPLRLDHVLVSTQLLNGAGHRGGADSQVPGNLRPIGEPVVAQIVEDDRGIDTVLQVRVGRIRHRQALAPGGRRPFHHHIFPVPRSCLMEEVTLRPAAETRPFQCTCASQVPIPERRKLNCTSGWSASRDIGTEESGILLEIMSVVSRRPKGLSCLPGCQMETLSAFHVSTRPHGERLRRHVRTPRRPPRCARSG